MNIVEKYEIEKQKLVEGVISIPSELCDYWNELMAYTVEQFLETDITRYRALISEWRRLSDGLDANIELRSSDVDIYMSLGVYYDSDEAYFTTRNRVEGIDTFEHKGKKYKIEIARR